MGYSITSLIGLAKTKLDSGLYLNSEANIGQQPAAQTPPWHGNIWVDSARYISGYGAVNLNDTLSNLQNSLFTTYQFEPSHNPTIPDNVGDAPFYVNDQGWFDLSPIDSSFNCDSSFTCPNYEPGRGGEEYRQIVADDNAVSSVFIPESKIIAQQFLYKELKTDSALLNSDILFEGFVDDKENESIGKLYEVEKEMKSVSAGAYSLSSNLISSNNFIKLYGDSIRYIDSLILYTPSTILPQLKENIINLLIDSRSSLNSAGSQLNANDNARITSALSKNNDVQPSQIPDTNEKHINDITLRYKAEGITVLINEYESVLQIAVQCPSSGGPAVYQARALIRLINDTIEYNDGDVCELVGIYRVQNVKKEFSSKELRFIPNPSNGDVMLVFSGLIGNEYVFEVNDLLGRKVIGRAFSSFTDIYQLQLPSLQNGIYSLKLSDNQGNHLTEKLIITK